MTKEDIVQAFKGFNSHSDDYLGALFIQITHELPISYRVFFNKTGELKYKISAESFGYRSEIDKKIDERQLLSLALYKAEMDEKLCIFSYSPNEWMIIYQSPISPFLMNVTLNEEGSVSCFYEDVYTTDITKTFEYIKSWFIPVSKEEKSEFGIAAVDASNSLYTNWYDYSYPEIDIASNYNDDIPYDEMCKALNNKDKPELLLFYGDPGTGKSSLIKHFISKFNEKDFVFIDGTLLANASQEKLMSYFLENQNTIFVLEDCEKVLMNREHNYNPVMPILLNLTDGVIGDVLGIKLICTFNTSLNNIDKALLRKGRLSVKYEFKPLCKEKVQKLLKDREVTGDMTLADIYYQEENDYSKKNTHRIGF